MRVARMESAPSPSRWASSRGTKFIDDHPEILAGPDARGVLPWLPSAADIAETIAFLASDRARCITGESINVSSGSYMRI